MFSKSEIKQRIADMRAEGIHLPSYNLMCFIVDNALLQQTDKTGISYAYHETACLYRIQNQKQNMSSKRA